MSEAKSKSTIHKKLLQFQERGISIKKSKTNPHFKNQYADINEVLDKVKPALSELGVVIVQIPQELGLKTVLHDTESGTEVESFLPYTNAPDPQKLGSHITYYRRYSLIALLGLEDNDDDGNSAREPQASTTRQAPVTLGIACKRLRNATSIEQLTDIYKKLPKNLRDDEEVIAMAKEVKQKLQAALDEMEEDGEAVINA